MITFRKIVYINIQVKSYMGIPLNIIYIYQNYDWILETTISLAYTTVGYKSPNYPKIKKD